MRSLAQCIGLVVVLAAFAAAQSPAAGSVAYLLPQDLNTNVLGADNQQMAAPWVRHATAAELHQQSAQLQRLMQDVGPKLANASQGVLDKDLTKELKQIEKLVKKLRGELND